MESLLLTLTWLLGLSCSVLGLIAALGFRARRSWKVIWGFPVLVALVAPLGAAYDEKKRRAVAKEGPIDYQKIGYSEPKPDPEDETPEEEDK